MPIVFIAFLMASNALAHDSPYDYAAAMKVVNGLDCKKLAETSDEKVTQKKYVDSFLLQIAEAFTGQKFESQEAARNYLENNVPETEKEMILSMAMPKIFSCIGEFVDKAFAQETPEKVGEINSVSDALDMMTKRITDAWQRPVNYIGGLEVFLRFELSPDGSLIDVQVTRSSGNTAFNRSAIRAIKATAPFVEISGFSSEVFEEKFKTMTIKFRPED